jgi:hypothetical protein
VPPAPRRPAGVARRRPIVGPPDPWWRRNLVAIVAAVVVIAGIGVVVGGLFAGSGSAYSCGSELQPVAGLSVANPIVTPQQGFNHVPAGTKIDYASCPPASGPHYSQVGVAPVPPRFYEPDAAIGPGSWVHNLEHGYAVALYRCTDGTCPSDADLQALRAFVQEGPVTASSTACGYRSKVLAVRFDDMATPYALVAWQRVLLLESFDKATALDFARTWIDKTAREQGC